MKISILQRRKQRLKGLKDLLEVAQVINERAEIQTQVICSAKAPAASDTGKASRRYVADISCLFKGTIGRPVLKESSLDCKGF